MDARLAFQHDKLKEISNFSELKSVNNFRSKEATVDSIITNLVFVASCMTSCLDSGSKAYRTNGTKTDFYVFIISFEMGRLRGIPRQR